MQVPLDAADGDDLAWLGFRLFARDRRWAPGGPLAIMRLAMPARDDGGRCRSLRCRRRYRLRKARARAFRSSRNCPTCFRRGHGDLVTQSAGRRHGPRGGRRRRRPAS
ncbi:hypothetical protein OWT26_10155 [Burkholderia sp. 1A5]